MNAKRSRSVETHVQAALPKPNDAFLALVQQAQAMDPAQRAALQSLPAEADVNIPVAIAILQIALHKKHANDWLNNVHSI